MTKKIKKNQGSKIELLVELSLEEFSPYIQRETERALREVHIQGFRKGNVPKELAMQYIHHEQVIQAAAERAVRESFVGIVAEEKWHVLEEPKIEVDPDAKKGLSYRAEFSVMPEVALPNYAKLAKNIFGARSEIKVEQKEVQDALNFLAQSRGERTKVEREAKDGDVIELHYSAYSPDREKTYFEDKSERIALGKDELLPGFDKELLGKKAGDRVEFSTATPADYFDENLKDKNVFIAAKLDAVLEKKVPELDDEFAKSIGGFENLAALKKSVEDGLREEKTIHANEKLKAQLLEALVKDTKVDVPDVLVRDMLEALFEDTKRFVVSHGKNWEEYLKSQGKTEEQIKEELKDRARERVISNLVVYQIAKSENLTPSEEEVEEEVKRLSSQFMGQKIEPQRLYNYAHSVLQSKKVFEHLESLAK